MERLQKIIAASGYCSRRKAEELILAKRVSVNGVLVDTLGAKADENDEIAIDGKVISKSEEKVVYLLNKPKNVISSASDDRGRKTVVDLIDSRCRLYPLGRNFYPNKLTYFILNEDLGCPAKNKSYIRISDWLEIADLDQYEAFQLKWHQIKLQTRAKMHDPQLSFETKKTLSIRFLNCFYKTPYPQDFYQEFYKRADAFTIQSVQNEV